MPARVVPRRACGLLKRHFESLGIGLCETAITWWSDNKRVRSLAQVEGLEHLDRALARGRGAILVGGHFTTIEIGTRILGTVVPMNVLFRPTKNRSFPISWRPDSQPMPSARSSTTTFAPSCAR